MENKVLLIAAENVGDGITLDAPLREAADSLELANLILELEEEFGLDIPDQAIGGIFNLHGVVRYIEAHG